MRACYVLSRLSATFLLPKNSRARPQANPCALVGPWWAFFRHRAYDWSIDVFSGHHRSPTHRDHHPHLPGAFPRFRRRLVPSPSSPASFSPFPAPVTRFSGVIFPGASSSFSPSRGVIPGVIFRPFRVSPSSWTVHGRHPAFSSSHSHGSITIFS